MGGIENILGANHLPAGWFERNWAQCGNAHDWAIERGLVITFGGRSSMRAEGVPIQLKNEFSDLWNSKCGKSYKNLHVIVASRKRHYRFYSAVELAPWCVMGNPYCAIGTKALNIYFFSKVFQSILVSVSIWRYEYLCPTCQSYCQFPSIILNP